jgi:uncharacterized surface protein with fasciclin (FAS1) repeats
LWATLRHQEAFFLLESTPKILLYHAVTGEAGQPARVLDRPALSAMAMQGEAPVVLDTLYARAPLHARFVQVQQRRTLTFNDHAVRLSNAPQLAAANGVLHVMHSVLLPPRPSVASR